MAVYLCLMHLGRRRDWCGLLTAASVSLATLPAPSSGGCSRGRSGGVERTGRGDAGRVEETVCGHACIGVRA